MDSQATRTVAPGRLNPITTLLRTISLPAIGTVWVEQGGVFAGIGRGQDGAPDFALIIADDPRGHFEDREWGKYGQDVPGACSYHNSFANTVAMAEAGCTLAQEIRVLDMAGHTDWCLPSQADLQLARANVSDHFEQGDYYWTSTQGSPGSAWVQGFEYGYSRIDGKGNELRAVAVRRFVL